MTRRLPAEWEPQSAIQITFPHEATDWAHTFDKVISCFSTIIKTISQYQKVLVVCRSIREAQAHLQSILSDRLLFAQADSDDSWSRDHGPITVFENGQPVLLDFLFNGWGGKFPADKDNRITTASPRRHDHMRNRRPRPNAMIRTPATTNQGALR